MGDHDLVVPNRAIYSDKSFFGHPKGLFVLFFTEMWERFSFYGMRALLVLYMTNYLIEAHKSGAPIVGFTQLRALFESMSGPLANQQLASVIYGWYTGFVYFTPIFGGMLADRVLGQRRTVYIGGVIMALGHFLMALENMFLPALLCLIVGNGFFKPNISTQVGNLYPPGDPRRDSAFTIFYMGINLGAVLSSFVCGYLGQKYGWHYGFGAAGVGMIIGLFVYFFGQKHLAPDQLTKAQAKHIEKKPLTKAEWKAVWGLCALCALNIVFWAVYEQQGNTMQVFADQSVDWSIGSFEMPSTWFQAINPTFIFLMGPVLISLWIAQNKRKKEPTSIGKMAIGCAVLGASFLILMYPVSGLVAGTKISFLWLVMTAFVYTVGELYLSPIGLSFVTKASPPSLVSMMMGMWMLSSFFGNILSGYVGMLYSVVPQNTFFLILFGLAVAAALLIMACKGPVQRAIGSDVL